MFKESCRVSLSKPKSSEQVPGFLSTQCQYFLHFWTLPSLYFICSLRNSSCQDHFPFIFWAPFCRFSETAQLPDALQVTVLLTWMTVFLCQSDSKVFSAQRLVRRKENLFLNTCLGRWTLHLGSEHVGTEGSPGSERHHSAKQNNGSFSTAEVLEKFPWPLGGWPMIHGSQNEARPRTWAPVSAAELLKGLVCLGCLWHWVVHRHSLFI